MNKDLKRLIYIIITTIILFLVGVAFIKLLPWLILGGFIIYVYFKIKRYLNSKNLKNNGFNTYEDTDTREREFIDNEDDDNVGIIDVEYEDIDDE